MFEEVIEDDEAPSASADAVTRKPRAQSKKGSSKAVALHSCV